ncbi:MAG TPA: VanZ family protein [Chitinophagaceae bacterium]|nr:VanZ family protein [Chitinophagaceae bacterium]
MVLSTGKKFFVAILLIACLLVLTKYILFKKSPRYYRRHFKSEYARYSISEGKKLANFVPFKTIRMMQNESLPAEYRVDNLGGNIVGFIPLGFLLPLLFLPCRRWWKTIAAIFFVSLGFETVQLLTGLGIFDVDDLILNVAGGMIGYILFLLFFGRRGRRTVTETLS